MIRFKDHAPLGFMTRTTIHFPERQNTVMEIPREIMAGMHGPTGWQNLSKPQIKENNNSIKRGFSSLFLWEYHTAERGFTESFQKLILGSRNSRRSGQFAGGIPL